MTLLNRKNKNLGYYSMVAADTSGLQGKKHVIQADKAFQG
jgi:hypothetical protein